MAYPSWRNPPGGAGAEDAVARAAARARDLAGRKEFAMWAAAPGRRAPQQREQKGAALAAGRPAYLPGVAPPALQGLRLTEAQEFFRAFFSPRSDVPRALVNWQTGAGKSIGIIAAANEFGAAFRQAAAAGGGGRPPAWVTVVSFTARETLQEDLLRYPELGFVTPAEAAALAARRAAAAAAAAAGAPGGGVGGPEGRALGAFVGGLRRRLTDPARGGFFRFYGYREFATRLFVTTAAGRARGFDAHRLCQQQPRGRGEDGAAPSCDFGAALAAAVRRGDVAVDTGFLDELRGGLLVADEVHNAYNSREANNYGVALQYALDALGDDAPRVVLVSATPMTGSAAEVVDLLNLLVPRAELPGGAPLRRGDFFLPRGRGGAATAAATAAEGEEGEEEEGDGGDGGDWEASELRPGALARIEALAAGRVSFLLDTDVEAYPRRLFAGEALPGVPYLRFTVATPSPLHAAALARERALRGGRPGAGFLPDAYALYDGVFPNPAFPPDAPARPGEAGGPFGLYRSGEVVPALERAPEEWREAAGAGVLRRGRETPVVSGAFLGEARLGAWSAKLARIVADVVAALRAGPGKILVYHPRVALTGCLFIGEALRMNGFVEEGGAPVDRTLCALCGAARRDHPEGGGRRTAPAPAGGGGEEEEEEGWGPAPAPHAFAPARFGLAHGELDRRAMLQTIARFNRDLRGRDLRVLVGSRVVRESLNFAGVRHELLAGMPGDFPTALQVFGRVVRKNSHAALPPGERDVTIRIYATGAPPGAPDDAPEVRRWAVKGQEFLVVQEVERALRRNAVDASAHAPRVRAAMLAAAAASSGAAAPGGEGGEGRPAPASLEGLPLPPAEEAPPPPWRTGTFEAYGFGAREVALLAGACAELFRARPAWTLPDLAAALREGAVARGGAALAAADPGNLAAALQRLREAPRPGAAPGDPPRVVVAAGPFLLDLPAGPGGEPLADVEAWLRRAAAPGGGASARPPPAPAPLRMRLAPYVAASQAGANFAVRLAAFERQYLAPGAPSALEASLLEFAGEFHVALLRRLAEAAAAGAGGGPRVTSDDGRLAALYLRFRVGVAPADLRRAGLLPQGEKARRAGEAGVVAGYATPDAVEFCQGGEGGAPPAWRSAPLAAFGFGRRFRENSVVVGFTADSRREFGRSGAVLRGAVFKTRPPLRGTEGEADHRTLVRGAVCETRPRDELAALVRRLRLAAAAGERRQQQQQQQPPGEEKAPEAPAAEFAASAAAAAPLDLSYAAKYDRAALKQFPSASELCNSVRLLLLAAEERERAAPGGMADGTRWLYLFSDARPAV